MSIPRPTLAGTLTLLATLSIGLACSSTPAQAVFVHRYLNQIPTENEPETIAAGPNGEIYITEVIATKEKTNGQTVTEYNPAGKVVRQFGALGSLPEGPYLGAVAVDSSGNLYVGESSESGGVDEFNSGGEFVKRLTGEDVPASARVGGVAVERLSGVATDADNDVYLFDREYKVIDEFTSTGVFVHQLAVGEVPATAPEPEPLLEPGSWAVDPANGNIYIENTSRRASANGLDSSIDEFDSADDFVMQVTGENIPAGAQVGGRFQHPGGMAVDSGGNIYVNDRRGAVDEFNSLGGFVTQLTGLDVPSSAPVKGTIGEDFRGGLAIGPNGELVVADERSRAVDVFERGLELASVAIGTPSGLSSSTVTFDGEVNPEGMGVTECRFEYGTGVSYGSSVPCSTVSGKPIGAGDGSVPVSAQAVGLVPGTTYHYRLAATNGEGTNFTSDGRLLTPPGVVGSVQASSVTSFAAMLTGLVEPGGSTAGYHFLYGVTSSYGSVLPRPDAIADAGGLQSVSQVLTGLEPDTTYHFALGATNIGGGVSVGADETFTTRPLVPPVVSTGGIEAVGETSVTLTGVVDPEGLASTYRFEYGPSTAYGSSWPLVQVFAGNGTVAQGVAIDVPNLQPGVTYHYRLVASNEDGTSYGADQTFTTPGYPVSVVEEAPVLTANLGFINPQETASVGKPSKAKQKARGKGGAKSKRRPRKSKGTKSSVRKRKHRTSKQ
jgi:hypothetical protein